MFRLYFITASFTPQRALSYLCFMKTNGVFKKTNSTTPFQSEKESNISLLSHYIPSMSAGDRAMRRYSGKFRVTRIGFQFTSDFSGS